MLSLSQPASLALPLTPACLCQEPERLTRAGDAYEFIQTWERTGRKCRHTGKCTSSYVNTHIRPPKSHRCGQTRDSGRVNNIPCAAHSPRLPLPSLNKTQCGGRRDNSQHLRLIRTWESRSLWAFEGRPLSLSSSRGSEERRRKRPVRPEKDVRAQAGPDY